MAQGVQRTPLVGVPHSGHELIGPSYRRTPTDFSSASMSALSSPRDTCTMGLTPFLGESPVGARFLVGLSTDRALLFPLVTEVATQAPQAQAQASVPFPSEAPTSPLEVLASPLKVPAEAQAQAQQSPRPRL